MTINYSLDFCPDLVKSKLSDFLENEFVKHSYSKTPTNYVNVYWNPATYCIEINAFAEDGFPLGYEQFPQNKILQ